MRLEHREDDRAEQTLKALTHGIELEHVSFGYELERDVLKDVSLTLKAGRAYAVVGTSGERRFAGAFRVTRLVVTHALDESLLKRYDGILTFKDGRSAEIGTFDELMAKKGFFYALYTVAH